MAALVAFFMAIRFDVSRLAPGELVLVPMKTCSRVLGREFSATGRRGEARRQKDHDESRDRGDIARMAEG